MLEHNPGDFQFGPDHGGGAHHPGEFEFGGREPSPRRQAR